LSRRRPRLEQQVHHAQMARLRGAIQRTLAVDSLRHVRSAPKCQTDQLHTTLVGHERQAAAEEASPLVAFAANRSDAAHVEAEVR